MNASQKLTSALKYQHHALVVVDGSFPVDALRYDRCFPYQEVDSRAIESSLNFGEPSERQFIVIAKYSETAKMPWFLSFWEGQSRLQFYEITDYQVSELRSILNNPDAKSAALDWVNRTLYALIRREPSKAMK